MTNRTNYTINESPHFEILSEDQKEKIFNGMMRTLQYTGANVHHEKARELFKKHGCKVDGVRVYFPPELILKALSTVPPVTEIFPWDGDESKKIVVEKNRSYFGPGPTPPNFIDTDTLERRPYLRKDASLVARVCDALPNMGYVQSLGSINDVTNGLADVYEFADMVRNTTTPIMSWSFTKDGCRDIHRMGIAMAGGEEEFRQRPNYIFYGEPISPLVSDYHAIDKCMYCAEHRIPQVYSPCAIGGGTVPATHAGQLVVALSESMVGVIATQLINPGTCVIIGGVQSILDMRFSIYSYGAPELSLLSAAHTEVVHYCGLPMYSTSGCTDTKKMDAQSAMEASLSINAAMMSGANFVHDNGYTESGITGDIFQTVMDDELISMARVIEKGIKIDPETLAVDVIDNVGSGGHYLYEDHTMNWFMEHWRPTLMDRNSYENWVEQGSKTMKDRIIEKTRDLIQNYEGPQNKVPAKASEEIEKILQEAEERIKKEGVAHE
ncbi:MAG: trimethylamine methyltransferase family protein [Bacteroidales bacterium]|nr:trimethylamine methyltransferase family protein [Bacteroidales bacterium]